MTAEMWLWLQRVLCVPVERRTEAEERLRYTLSQELLREKAKPDD